MKSKRYKSRCEKWQIQENPVAGDIKELRERGRCDPILRSMILTGHISSFFLHFIPLDVTKNYRLFQILLCLGVFECIIYEKREEKVSLRESHDPQVRPTINISKSSSAR